MSFKVLLIKYVISWPQTDLKGFNWSHLPAASD